MTSESTAPLLEDSSLPGVNVCLMGPAGTGKTHSLGTAVEAAPEHQFFYLGLEPGLESLIGYFQDKGKPVPPNLHWHTIKSAKAGFAEFIDAATKINTLSQDSLHKLTDPHRSKHNQFISILEALNNFPDDRTGQKFGGVDSWGTDHWLLVDGLTGLGRASMAMVVGGKPVRSQPDWGIAQDQVERLLRMLCDSCRCHFVLLAHVERETDMILGGVKLMVSTLGQKLAPKIPSMFSDVVLTVRTGDKWTWDTSNTMADLKTRNLPISSSIKPDFAAIIDKWKSRAAASQTG